MQPRRARLRWTPGDGTLVPEAPRASALFPAVGGPPPGPPRPLSYTPKGQSRQPARAGMYSDAPMARDRRPGTRWIGGIGRLASLAALAAHLACAPARMEANPALRDNPPLLARTPSDPGSKFEGNLEAELRAARPGDRFRAIVDLTEQVDLEALGQRLRSERRSKSHRRRAVIGALERVAERQQARLRPVLGRLQKSGHLDYVRPVAIVNRLVVDGTAAGILELGGHPEVARVLREWTSDRPAKRAPLEIRPARAPGERFESWAIRGMGVERLWAAGLTGRGVLVATIDSGVAGDHEQLRGGRIPGSRGWFDPVEGAATPYDSDTHGTGVLSQAVGSNPRGRILGVAPGARWAAALGNYRNRYSRVRMTIAADWVLRVARPDVLINAWSNNESPCAEFDVPFINAWKAAEIFVVFPAGNGGPGPRTGEAPAQLAGVYPGRGPVFSVAGLDRWNEAARDSSRGPSACGSPRFPAIAAPASDLPFAFPAGADSYGIGGGTSLAAGLVGGAAAVLLEADPELSPDELERILSDSARDLPPPGRDDATGAGALDLAAALELVRAPSRAR